MQDEKIEQNKPAETANAVKARTEATRAKLALYIEGLENLINDYKPSINANKRVLMLPLSKLPLAKDKETGEIYVSKDLKPQLFNKAKAARMAKEYKTENEGHPQIVTKLDYYKARLKAAKGLLDLMNKGLQMKAVKPQKMDDRTEEQRVKYRQLNKQYGKLSDSERKSERGQTMRAQLIELRAALKEAQKDD